MNIEDALHEVQRCIDRVGFTDSHRIRWQSCHDELYDAFVKPTAADIEAADEMFRKMQRGIRK